MSKFKVQNLTGEEFPEYGLEPGKSVVVEEEQAERIKAEIGWAVEVKKVASIKKKEDEEPAEAPKAKKSK